MGRRRCKRALRLCGIAVPIALVYRHWSTPLAAVAIVAPPGPRPVARVTEVADERAFAHVRGVGVLHGVDRKARAAPAPPAAGPMAAATARRAPAAIAREGAVPVAAAGSPPRPRVAPPDSTRAAAAAAAGPRADPWMRRWAARHASSTMAPTTLTRRSRRPRAGSRTPAAARRTTGQLHEQTHKSARGSWAALISLSQWACECTPVASRGLSWFISPSIKS